MVLSPLSSSMLDKVQSLAARINSPMKIGAPCDYELQKSSWELHRRMTTVRLLSYDDMSPHVANESLEVGELDITGKISVLLHATFDVVCMPHEAK